MKNIKKELKGSLSEEKLANLKKEIGESLAIDRHSLICDFPFTAAISMRMDLIPVRDKRIRTACTDGKSVYFDCDFYSRLKRKERMFVLAHEIWHCVMLHLSRCQTRDRQLFNIATDMEVNNLLVENAAGKDIAPPDEVLFPPDKLKGKSAEVIYDWLLKQAQKKQKTSGMPMSGAGGNDADNNDSNNSDVDDCDNDASNGKNHSKKAKNDSKKDKDGKNSGDLKGQFDKHTYTDDNGDGDVNDTVTDQWGEVGYDDDFCPSVPSDIAEKMREAAIAAAQQCQRETGGLPGAVKSLLDKVMKPEIDWKDELCNFVTMVYGDGRMWLPPNRRYVYDEMYFQSKRESVLKIAVAVDTSGSCIGDLPKFFGELNGLLNSFGKYELTLIQNDYAISRVDTFDQDNPFDPEDFEWEGGGGTSFKPPFEWLKEHNPDIDCFVFFTDGYEGFYDDSSCVNKDYPEPPYPVLWVLTKDGNKDFCPWGKKIFFKESAYGY